MKSLSLLVLVCVLPACGPQNGIWTLSDEQLRESLFESMSHLPPIEATLDFSLQQRCEVTPWEESHPGDDSRQYVQFQRVPVREYIRVHDVLGQRSVDDDPFVLAPVFGMSIEERHRFWASTWAATSDITCGGELSNNNIVLVEEMSRGEDVDGDYDYADSLFDESRFQRQGDMELSYAVPDLEQE